VVAATDALVAATGQRQVREGDMATLSANSSLLGRRAWLCWTAAAAIGMAGGFVAVVVTPVAIFVEILAVIALALPGWRPFCVAGGLLGHGLVWSWLVGWTSGNCLFNVPAECAYWLPASLGTSQVGATAWTQTWFFGAILPLLAGFVLTAALAWRARSGRFEI
jgi:hypothetical protein